MPQNSSNRESFVQECRDSHFKANRSSLNNSLSKAMHRFPTQPRFPDLSKHQSNPDTAFAPRSALNPRATSLGYGKKADIAPKNASPPPNRYNLTSEFQKSPKKGVSLRKGRSDCKSVSIFYQSTNPAPGTYKIPEKQAKNLTMSSKLKFPSLWARSQAPGPGACKKRGDLDELEPLDSYGNCVTSKYKSKGSFKISNSKANSYQKATENVAPNSYQTDLSSHGKQLLAAKRTQSTTIFPKKLRKTFEKENENPGPGSYQHYSMFGLI